MRTIKYLAYGVAVVGALMAGVFYFVAYDAASVADYSKFSKLGDITLLASISAACSATMAMIMEWNVTYRRGRHAPLPPTRHPRYYYKHAGFGE